MHYRLAAFDLDGTIIDDKKKLTRRTARALRELQKRGTAVALNSGRAATGVIPVADQLLTKRGRLYASSFNGGVVVDCMTGILLEDRYLPDGTAARLWDFCRKEDFPMYAYTDTDLLCSTDQVPFFSVEARVNCLQLTLTEDFRELDSRPIHKCAFFGDHEALLDVPDRLNAIFEGDIFSFMSEPFLIDVMPVGVTKAGAVEKLAARLGIRKEEIIAFGDGYNDLGMLAAAGTSVAMENGAPELKAAADYICPPNSEDGVAVFLERLMEKD